MNTGDIDLIYSMCSFDKAWRPKDLSPWCAVGIQRRRSSSKSVKIPCH